MNLNSFRLIVCDDMDNREFMKLYLELNDIVDDIWRSL